MRDLVVHRYWSMEISHIAAVVELDLDDSSFDCGVLYRS
jgi:hypothetical protein